MDVRVDEWSLEGFVPPRALVGYEGDVLVTLPFQGFWITFASSVAHVPETGLLQFTTRDPRHARLMRHVHRGIVSGRFVPVENMIASMDAPVEIVPMQETPAEAAREQARHVPRIYRVAAVLCLYVVLGYLAYEPIARPVWNDARAYFAQSDVASF
jgi:hypothetical protein